MRLFWFLLRESSLPPRFLCYNPARGLEAEMIVFRIQHRHLYETSPAHA